MLNSIIAEGKTTNEAISNGLKELKVSRDNVNIKVLENADKRSFFSILAPRVVKVELTLKEDVEEVKSKENDGKNSIKRKASKEDIEKAKRNIEEFLIDFSKNFEDITYEIAYEEMFLKVQIKGESSSKLIGYRGDMLNSLQVIMNKIANKNLKDRVRVTIDVGDYKEKREKSLEQLADKIAKTVLKTGKSITLEPMQAYERKIIHNRLQQNNKVKTYSTGEEPYRKVVISKK